MSLFLSFLSSPGTLHSAGAAEEAKADRPKRGRCLAWSEQRVRGPSGRSRRFSKVRLRLRPPGRVWRADHLREEHEALVSGPGHLCL